VFVAEWLHHGRGWRFAGGFNVREGYLGRRRASMLGDGRDELVFDLRLDIHLERCRDVRYGLGLGRGKDWQSRSPPHDLLEETGHIRASSTRRSR
jgi:hypothetical protein